MGETRAYSRIVMKNGRGYAVAETIREISPQLDEEEWISLTSVTGSEMFQDETLLVRTEDISSVQEISETGWIWQQEADTLHAAQQLQALRQGPGEMAEVQREMVRALKGHLGEEDDE